MIKNVVYRLYEDLYIEASLQLSGTNVRIRARLIENHTIVDTLTRDYPCDVQSLLSKQVDTFIDEFEKISRVTIPRPFPLSVF